MRASNTGLHTLRRPLASPIPSPQPCRIRSRCISRRSQSTLLEKAAPHLPRILQPSMWQTILPTTLRSRAKDLFTPSKTPSNPATYFLWIYLLIGSQAIRLIQLKNDYATYSRRADLQIEKLREVVRKLQAGEEVDVEKVLGTGMPEEEEAWEEALREIQEEERVWTEGKAAKREKKRMAKEQAEREAKEREDASPVSGSTREVTTKPLDVEASPLSASKAPYAAPGFY